MGPRRLIAAVLGLLCLGAFAPPAGAALSADSMLSPTTVVAIDLQLSSAAMAALAAEPDEYVEGTFRIAETGGAPATIGPYSDPLTVGIRLKGGTSFQGLDGKAAFKVKFNEFVAKQKFLGLKSLTLNNMVQDPSMIHEVLAYRGFRAAGIAAPHAGYAYVHLNGVDYGLHLNLETVDDVALEKRFGPFADPPQHLYEAGPSVDLTPGGAGAFEVDEGDDGALGDLEALIAAANASSPSFSARLAPVADLAQMTKMWAAERYLGHWDGYSGRIVNNYHLLSDAAGVFQMLPWGTDQTMTDWRYPFTGEGGLLFEQCLGEAACLAAYTAALGEVEEATTALDLAPQASQLAALLAPWQTLEIEHSERERYGAGAIERAVGRTLHFLGARADVLAGWLQTGEVPPAPEGPPNPFKEVPGPPASISTRLEIDRSKLGRGLVLARVAVSGAGTIGLVGEVGPQQDRRRACAVEQRGVEAGASLLPCRLSEWVRQRLGSRPLTLRLRVNFQPLDGAAAVTVPRSVRLPRQAL